MLTVVGVEAAEAGGAMCVSTPLDSGIAPGMAEEIIIKFENLYLYTALPSPTQGGLSSVSVCNSGIAPAEV
jgi:hypothetical protein